MANLVHKDIEVEDWGMATFTFASGLVATLEASWNLARVPPTISSSPMLRPAAAIASVSR